MAHLPRGLPVFAVKRGPGAVSENFATRDLVTCTIDGEVGAARVFSGGEAEARLRAQAQAEAKLTERGL